MLLFEIYNRAGYFPNESTSDNIINIDIFEFEILFIIQYRAVRNEAAPVLPESIIKNRISLDESCHIPQVC